MKIVMAHRRLVSFLILIKRPLIFILASSVVLTFSGYRGYSQSQEKVYALLMLNFAKGIQWPKESDEPFTIGVLEYPPLAQELNSAISSIKIGSKKVVVREFAHIDEIDKCHIIFIPAYKAKQLPGLLNKLGNAPTLIITNKMDLAKKGSGVNFILVDGKLRYELNTKSIEKRGMRISANLKGMGILVE